MSTTGSAQLLDLALDVDEPRLALSVQLDTDVGLAASERRARRFNPTLGLTNARALLLDLRCLRLRSRACAEGGSQGFDVALLGFCERGGRSGQRLGFVRNERTQTLDLSDGALDRLWARRLPWARSRTS